MSLRSWNRQSFVLTVAVAEQLSGAVNSRVIDVITVYCSLQSGHLHSAVISNVAGAYTGPFIGAEWIRPCCRNPWSKHVDAISSTPVRKTKNKDILESRLISSRAGHVCSALCKHGGDIVD